MQKHIANVSADRFGILASGACMVHCGLTPLFFALAPGLAHYVPGDEIVHRSLAVLVLSAGVIALVRGYRVHRRLVVFAGFAAGAALVLIGAMAGKVLGSHLAETAITLAGSTSMIISHWKNRAFCSDCTQCDHD
jgi:hypothetical protein